MTPYQPIPGDMIYRNSADYSEIEIYIGKITNYWYSHNFVNKDIVYKYNSNKKNWSEVYTPIFIYNKLNTDYIPKNIKPKFKVGEKVSVLLPKIVNPLNQNCTIITYISEIRLMFNLEKKYCFWHYAFKDAKKSWWGKFYPHIPEKEIKRVINYNQIWQDINE